MGILATATKLLGSAFNAWLMKPIYQAIIVILIIAIIYMIIQQKKAKA
jgi:uncharacterized membrane protein